MVDGGSSADRTFGLSVATRGGMSCNLRGSHVGPVAVRRDACRGGRAAGRSGRVAPGPEEKAVPDVSVGRRHRGDGPAVPRRSEEHTSELQSRQYLVCRLLLEKKKKPKDIHVNALHARAPAIYTRQAVARTSHHPAPVSW